MAAVVVGIGLFYGGFRYGENKAVTNRGNFAGNAGMMRNGGGRGNFARGGSLAAGDIIAKDDKSFTVKSIDGGSKIIFFSTSTQVMRSAAGSLADLKVGDRITAEVSNDASGVATARSIQVR